MNTDVVLTIAKMLHSQDVQEGHPHRYPSWEQEPSEVQHAYRLRAAGFVQMVHFAILMPDTTGERT